MQLPLPSVIMPPTTETEIKELRDLVIGLREEIRVGFAKVDTKLAEIQGQINVLEERTKLGFWGFIGRAVIIGIFSFGSRFCGQVFFVWYSQVIVRSARLSNPYTGIIQ
jgi:hypothetical protein